MRFKRRLAMENWIEALLRLLQLQRRRRKRGLRPLFVHGKGKRFWWCSWRETSPEEAIIGTGNFDYRGSLLQQHCANVTTNT